MSILVWVLVGFLAGLVGRSVVGRPYSVGWVKAGIVGIAAVIAVKGISLFGVDFADGLNWKSTLLACAIAAFLLWLLGRRRSTS